MRSPCWLGGRSGGRPMPPKRHLPVACAARHQAATVTMYQCWPPNGTKLLQDPKSQEPALCSGCSTAAKSCRSCCARSIVGLYGSYSHRPSAGDVTGGRVGGNGSSASGSVWWTEAPDLLLRSPRGFGRRFRSVMLSMEG